MTTYYVDPVNGLDTNDGSSWALAYKTLKKSFAAGDLVYVAKSPETALSGTVSATQGNASVATTEDLTGVLAQYSIIRIGGDATLYMVRAITASVITLYRPYRGTTGAGKSATYFTGLPTSASNDWQPTAMIGTAASPITVQGGINPSNNEQDGFTILYGNNATYLFNGTWTWVNLSRVASLYFQYPWTANFNDGVVINCFSFRSSQMSLNKIWSRVIVNGFVSELGKWHYGLSLYGCTINQPETAESETYGWNNSSVIYDSIVNQWRNAGYSGKAAIYFYANNNGVRFVDAILDELDSGCPNIMIGTTNPRLSNVYFQNPLLGSGTAFSLYSASYYFVGSIGLSNVNGSATDHRTYWGILEAGKYALISYDSSIYQTAAPSAKVNLYQASFPTVIKHYIPVEAGVQKTVSVYFRKNSSYGSSTRPTMRLRWLTGAAPDLVSNVHDEVMSDSDDTWVQVSYAVTPSVKGSIIMELIFQSAISGAIAWYDDIGVQ